MRKYNSYHTTLKQLAKRNSLPGQYSSVIDRTTLWRWRKKPDDKYKGSELREVEVLESFISRKEAQVMMKTYLKVILTLGTFVSSTKVFHKLLRDNKKVLVAMK